MSIESELRPVPQIQYQPVDGKRPRVRGRAVETRNGLPVSRPYVYRGTGADEHPETSKWRSR